MAQLVARLFWEQEVVSSNPATPTKYIKPWCLFVRNKVVDKTPVICYHNVHEMKFLSSVNKKIFMRLGYAVLIGLLFIFFTGCGANKQLAAPVLLHVSDSYFASWTIVENAKDYTVNIEGTEYQTSENSFQIPIDDITQEIGTFKIKVRANAGTKSYKSSAYSDELLFYKVGKLDTPIGLQIDSAEEYLSWAAVPNAISYIVSIDEVEFAAESNSFEIAEVNFAGLLDMKVKAVGDAKPYADSVFSQSITHKVTRPLATPNGGSIVAANGQIAWEAIPNAVQYTVEIDSAPVAAAEN